MQPSSELLKAAARARANAYAPYSGYKVGAAILDEHGAVHSGCNVENVSYGATICAERNALTTMVAEGGTKAKRMALVTEDGGTPCGICLQCLSEFSSDLEIEIYSGNQLQRVVPLSEFLPTAFSSSQVNRT